MPTVTNLITNPSAEIMTNGLPPGWVKESGVALSEVVGASGSGKAIRYTSSIAGARLRPERNSWSGWLVPSTPYKLSYKIKRISGAGDIRYAVDNAGSNIVTGTLAQTPVGQWVTRSASFTTPASLSGHGLSAFTAGDVFECDDFMLVQLPLVDPMPAYFDGGTPGAYWTGVPHASTSVMGATVVLLGQAVEVDSAPPITRTKTRTLAQAVETDTALPITRLKSILLGLPVETDLALAIARHKTLVLGLPVEVDVALPLIPRYVARAPSTTVDRPASALVGRPN